MLCGVRVVGLGLAGAALVAPALVLWASPGAADRVVPSDRVRSRVVVRSGPQRNAPDVGRLEIGGEARLLDSSPGWHHVELRDATRGWVNAFWTRVVPEPPPVAAPSPEPPSLRPVRQRSLLERLRSSFEGFVGLRSSVDFLIDDEAPRDRLYRNRDPMYPVSGFATPAGSNGLYDIIVAIDASASTNEFSQADVDGDGVLEDGWRGDDSIYRAQIVATRGFLQALARLPGNEDGGRIRVGVVRFSGDDRYAGDPSDRDFEPSVERIEALARRDAELVAPLSHDYAELDRRLEALSRREASGMTDFAAGIGRAILELDGSAALGASGTPREGAERVINFLTDGSPSLPYGPEQAENAARFASRMAKQSGIRVNSFELGENAVTRKLSPAVDRVARGAGGSVVEIERPGEIVAILRGTSLSFVERVKLVNRTTALETDYIATGVDGSFYGEVPLREGDNELEIVAVLFDDLEDRARFRVRYVDGDPIPELVDHLAALKARNQALIDEIRARLARRMQAERAERQRKQLSLD
jgi:hypothetical protein